MEIGLHRKPSPFLLKVGDIGIVSTSDLFVADSDKDQMMISGSFIRFYPADSGAFSRYPNPYIVSIKSPAPA